MENFYVEDLVETRSDRPDLFGYSVNLNNKEYVLYYRGNKLREVYFINWFDKYFMSCRADLKTISHYYINEGTIDRYENGVLNRTYICPRKGVTINQ